MGHIKTSDGNDRGDRACAVLAFIAALVLMVTCGTRSAYADVDWHEKGANMSATVGPWSYPEGREFALSEFLGYDWSSLSLQVRNDILNDSNGDNQFKQLLDHNVLNVQYESGGGALNWPVVSIWSQLFGLDEMWDIETTNERYVAAQEVMKKYIFPREDEDDDEPIVPEGSVFTLTGDGKVYNKKAVVDAGTMTLTLTGNALTSYQQYIATHPYVYAFVSGIVQSSNNTRYLYGGIYISDKEITTLNYGTTGDKKNVYDGVNANTVQIDYYDITIQFPSDADIYEYSWNGYVDRSYTQSRATNIDCSVETHRTANYYNEDLSRVNQNFFYYMDNGGGGTGGEPYVPTPDPTPTKPTIQIGDVTVDLSNGPYTVNNTTYSVVYAPDNSWSIQVETHTDNQYGGDVTATDPTDYTSILNAILAAINALRSEVNGFNNQINANITNLCNTLNASIKAAETELNGQLQTMQTQQHNDIQTLQTNLQNNFNGKMDAFASDLWSNMSALDSDLIEEMDAVARYIVDSMDFGDAYNDKNIITWLKKIYARLGSKPVIKNPTEDPKGWFDDLKKLLEKILETALAGVDTAALATLWNTAKSHFPLSLPWDMLAIVGLLAHEPITPAVDYPIVFNDVTIAEIEVDLSDYEDVADVTRKMSLIVFAMGLLITYPQIFHTLEPLTKALRG